MKCEPIKRDEVAQEVFLVAERFSAAQNALEKADESTAATLPGYDVSSLLALPGIVLEAFSAELYLKSLHAALGTVPPPRGHDLWLLFNALDASVRMEISRHYGKANAPLESARKARQPKAVNSSSLEDKLKEAARAFVDIRYPWEDDFRVRNFEIGVFRAVVREAVLRRRPDFRRLLSTMRITGHVFTPCGPHCRGVLSVCKH
jgi:hypothetical protein